MQHNEPGREPTEPTDAELLLRFGKEVRAAKLGVGKMSDGEALLNAIIARGEEYLSGQRPMPDTTAPDEQDATLVKLIDLLTRTANAVKGQPGEMKQHGWADLPELCTALSARVAELEAELATMRPVYAAAKDYAQCCKDGTLGQVGAKDELLWLFHGYKLAQPAPGKEAPDA